MQYSSYTDNYLYIIYYVHPHIPSSSLLLLMDHVEIKQEVHYVPVGGMNSMNWWIHLMSCYHGVVLT